MNKQLKVIISLLCISLMFNLFMFAGLAITYENQEDLTKEVKDLEYNILILANDKIMFDKDGNMIYTYYGWEIDSTGD